MCIQAGTIKHSNTRLEHQNNLQKAKHKLLLHNWQALQFTFQTKQTRRSPHKHKGALKVQANKGFTHNTTRGQANTKHSYTKRQHLCSGVVRLFGANWNKSGKCQIMTFSNSLSTQRLFKAAVNNTSMKQGHNPQ